MTLHLLLAQALMLLKPLIMQAIQQVRSRGHFDDLISEHLFDSKLHIVLGRAHERINLPVLLLSDIHHLNGRLEFLNFLGLASWGIHYVLLSGLFKSFCDTSQVIRFHLRLWSLVFGFLGRFLSGVFKVVNVLLNTILYWIFLRDQKLIFEVFVMC